MTETKKAMKRLLEMELKHCSTCGQKEELHMFENSNGDFYGAVAQCPNNHFGRVLRAPSNFWQALG